jgi:hypothetical protein
VCSERPQSIILLLPLYPHVTCTMRTRVQLSSWRNPIRFKAKRSLKRRIAKESRRSERKCGKIRHAARVTLATTFSSHKNPLSKNKKKKKHVFKSARIVGFNFPSLRSIEARWQSQGYKTTECGVGLSRRHGIR